MRGFHDALLGFPVIVSAVDITADVLWALVAHHENERALAN